MGVPVADAPVAYALLLIISACSLYGLFADRSFVTSGMFDLSAVRRGGQWWRVVTSAFLHADLTHLLVNSLTFYFFGPVVEAIYGTESFLLIFFGSQLGAMALTMYAKRADANYRSLGASGAVSGVLLAFCIFAPFQYLYLFFAIPIPAIVFAAGYIGFSAFAMGGPGRISHEAHLGGAIVGAALGLLLKPDFTLQSAAAYDLLPM